jgi:DNA polymerase-1
MSSGPETGCLYLIDAHSLIFQVFHAIPAMSSPNGRQTNALFGFTRDVLYLRTDKKPDYLVCAFDVSGPTFRDRLYPEYKAHRSPMPDDLQTQIPLIYQLLEAMRVPVLGKEGFEADDVIATVARAAAQRGLEVFICTSDKDCRQLIDDRVRLFNLRKKEVMDREALWKDWEIKPEQVIDLQTLVGDSVDNIPGVPGIGPKTAAKLLQEFGTLDNLLANLDRVAGKKQETLRASGEKIRLSRQLVSLSTDVPLEMDWLGWRVRQPDTDRLLALFQEWGFHRFATMVRTEFPAPSQPASVSEVRQRDLFAPAADGVGIAKNQQSTIQNQKYSLVDTPEKFRIFLTELRRQKRIALDLETTSLEPRRAEIVGYAFCWQPAEAYYLPVRGPDTDARLDPTETLKHLRPILENPDIAKVNQNIKYDLMVLRQNGIEVRGIAGDSMVADYLLHAGERSHNMEDLATRYLNHQIIPITDLIGKKGSGQLRMDQVGTARVAEYSGEDADVAWRLCDILETKLREEKLEELYRDLEVPLIEVLAEMEFNGIRLDVPLLQQVSLEMAEQLKAVEADICQLAGRAFNIASPKQLREVLFDELKLPRQRRTGITGEASTGQETLERLAALGHALPVKILEHRQIAKLKGTYVDALPGLVNPVTGRVHAAFNQTVAATGRLSSSDPNLQNIPVRSEQGRQIRQAFLPEEGWLLLTADYSQIELRMLAHFSGDAALRRAFADEADIHASVAAQIYGVPEEEVTSEMRRAAKTVNFGVIYGMSAFGLAQRLGIPKEEAAGFIDAYFARFSKVADYQSQLLEKCRRTGYVSTILGRRREISGIRPESSYQQRNQPEREAINMEIQGSAADLIKMAMLKIYRRLKASRFQTRLLMQIHDELVLEVPPEELHAAADLITEEMTTALKLEVPLQVDVAAGRNWLDVEEIEDRESRIEDRESEIEDRGSRIENRSPKSSSGKSKIIRQKAEV